MIERLDIKNFKSIKHLTLNCKRLNLFIGEPNTGKSNILEAIGLLSHAFHGKIGSFVRFENMRDLFYDHNLENILEVRLDEGENTYSLRIKFKDGIFVGSHFEGNIGHVVFSYDYSGGDMGGRHLVRELNFFKFYRFAVKKNFPDHRSEFLLPPDGNNLLSIILVNKKLRTLLKQLFDHFELRLVLEPEEGKIKVQKQLEDIIVSFPYSLVSDTLQRLVFYLTAIHSNQNSTLAFEEPEAHAFPYHTKYLAETIALDKNKNQYFISTHNPYFLLSMLEKTPKDDIGVFYTRLENYQTKVKALTEKNIEDVLEKGIDLFFNIERFLG